MKIVIIGNGISGVTCARNIRKVSKDPITIISEESDHFYSRTALMYIYMGHMRYEDTKPYEDHFWKKNSIHLIKKRVTKVDIEKKLLQLSDESTLTYDVLILATGSKSNTFGWPGQELQGAQTLYNLQDLEKLNKNSEGASHAVIVGGGLIGIEMAEMLHSRKIGVTFLVRENNFWGAVLPVEESNLVSRHIREHHVDLRLGSELKEIKGNASGKVESILTGQGEVIPCQIVGLTVGVSPNIAFLKDSGIETDRGILVNEYFETNTSDIYAIGDCAQFRKPLPGRRPIEQVWYTGRMHGETLASTLTGNKRNYSPGPWFNSAKFFDIEYQTYGTVNPKPEAHEANLYWEEAGGKICIRIVYDKESDRLIGINVFGIRLRHAIFEKWIQEGRSRKHVLDHLEEANFDPEFYKRYESDIRKRLTMIP